MKRNWLILGTIALLTMIGGIFMASPQPNSFLTKIEQSPKEPGLALLDPEMAPEEIRPTVMLGFRIMQDTKKLLPQYAGDRISCTNCHFDSGNTFGGINDGISLVGVTKVYPKVIPGNPHQTLEERINECFRKSLSGNPLPLDAPEMKAMVAYLEWISQGISTNEVPWLGLKKLHITTTPNPERGKVLFAQQCAPCHGSEGQGKTKPYQLSYPPLWGENAFMAEAGMNEISTLTSFIYYNMPYQSPDLTVDEALDIAAFVTQQPRPRLNHK